jgi:hypothetical protein
MIKFALRNVFAFANAKNYIINDAPSQPSIINPFVYIKKKNADKLSTNDF